MRSKVFSHWPRVAAAAGSPYPLGKGEDQGGKRMAGETSIGSFDYVIIGAGSAGCVLAEALSRDWQRKHVKARAHFIAEYYLAAQAPFHARLRQRGLSDAQIGTHAGAGGMELSARR